MKIINYFKNPKQIILVLMNKNMLFFLPDKSYLKIKYYLELGKKLNLENPHTFNEKLQWLKLYDRKSEYTQMVDKVEAKKHAEKIIGKKYIVPTIGVYEKFDDINFDELPNQFVMKCSHDSGGLVICKDKKSLNVRRAKKTINKYLRRKYYYIHREWPYKDVRPRIIVEQYLEDKNVASMRDYKFFCFSGEPEIVLVCTERFTKNGTKETWFDGDWNLLPIIEGGHKTDPTLKAPQNFKKMKELARILSKKNAFLRIDFYEVNGVIYFGEYTFSPAAGYERFSPESWDRKLGDLINLEYLKK